MKLPQSYYLNNSVTQVAEDLIGKTIYTNFDNRLTAGVVVETEAYSFKEKACHAYNNRRTARTETLFAEGGTSYVYLCYGIHKLFNIVTNTKDVAEAVLIRAVEPVIGQEIMFERRGITNSSQLTTGPGKLSQALGIGLAHNKLRLFGNEIWLEDNGLHPEVTIEKSPRIGVAYAREDALLPWRFTMKSNPWVSKGNNSYNPGSF